MAASLMNMLDNLEARLERTQAELQALREENQRLKQQLGDQAAPLADTESEGSRASELESARESTDENKPNNEIESPAVEETPAVEKALAIEKTAPVEAASPAQTPKPEAPDKAEVTPEIKAKEPPPAVAKLPSPNALLNTWYERYPKAFFKGHTKPLKIGIHQDLAEREEWPNKLIRRALANYVNLPRYIKAVRAGAERVDLDGLPAGKVDKDAASHAAEKRSDQQMAGQSVQQPAQNASATKKTEHHKQRKAQVMANMVNKPRPEGVKQPEPEKREPRKQLSMEDKLIGLQQKFKGR